MSSLAAQWHLKHALAALSDFFKYTKFTEENYSDRCSVHVHVNCTNMRMEQISSVTLLYTIAEEILFEYVGHYRDTNIYCIPWSDCRAQFDLVSEFLGNPTTHLKSGISTRPLNLLPLTTQGTMEFRQMHGTSDHAKLTRWINIIGGMFKTAMEVPMDDLVKEIKTLNSTSQYESFFNRLVSSQLPYTEAYRQRLEAGVIMAKYSLIGLDKAGKREETMVVEEAPVAAPEPTLRADARAAANRLGAMADMVRAYNLPQNRLRYYGCRSGTGLPSCSPASA